jgi:hypothetical protein
LGEAGRGQVLGEEIHNFDMSALLYVRRIFVIYLEQGKAGRFPGGNTSK